MAIIATRKPYTITRNTTDLEVKIKSWSVIEPTEYQHTVQKSTNGGAARDLVVEVSQFIRDYFVMTPADDPANITTVKTGEFLNVKISINDVEESHRAVNGYVSPVSEAYYDHWQTTKRIHYDTDCQVSLPPGIYTVTWTTDDGQTATEDTTSTTYPHTASVANSNIDLSTAKRLTVATDLYIYKYDVVCPYMDGTIGFVNSVGMWEYLDINGRQDLTYTRESSQYMPYNVGELRDVDVSGGYSVRVNTGWVDEEFRRVIEELMVSKYIIWKYATTYEYLILDTKSIRRERRVTDKMMKYGLSFTFAKPVIPVVEGGDAQLISTVVRGL